MAFASTSIWEVNGGGSDANGGGFDPSNANMAADLAATNGNTSTPTVTSASYTFVAGDVGHYVFVKSGANWIAGWYKITSVATGAATLDAAIGKVWLADLSGFSSTVGIATVASPTAGTWSVDYSIAVTPGISYTDLVIDATTNTKYTSAANPVAKNLVGNIVNITSGTGFTVQRAQVVSTAGTIATVDKSLGTLGSTGGVGAMGGALASPGQAGALKVANNTVFIRNTGGGTPTTYLMSNTANVSGGKVSDATNATAPGNFWIGYETNRSVVNTDANLPVLSANANSVTCFTQAGQNGVVRNLKTDNNGAFTSVGGFASTGVQNRVEFCFAKNATGTGFALNTSSTKGMHLAAEACGTGFALSGGAHMYDFSCKNCTAMGVSLGASSICAGGLITGTSNIGLFLNGTAAEARNTTVFGSTGASGDGVKFTTNLGHMTAENVLSYGNAQKDFNLVSTDNLYRLWNCAGSSSSVFTGRQAESFATLTVDPFVSSGGGDFRLNATAGGGILCRGTGLPQAFLGYPTVQDAPDIGGYQRVDGANPASTFILTQRITNIIVDEYGCQI